MWHPPFKDLYPWRQRPHPRWVGSWQQQRGGVGIVDTTIHNPCEAEAFADESRELRSTSNPWYCWVLLLPGEFAAWKEARKNIILSPCHWVFTWGLVRRVVWHFVLGSKEIFCVDDDLRTGNFHVLGCRCFFGNILMHSTAGLRQCPRCYCSYGDSCHHLRSCDFSFLLRFSDFQLISRRGILFIH